MVPLSSSSSSSCFFPFLLDFFCFVFFFYTFNFFEYHRRSVNGAAAQYRHQVVRSGSSENQLQSLSAFVFYSALLSIKGNIISTFIGLFFLLSLPFSVILPILSLLFLLFVINQSIKLYLCSTFQTNQNTNTIHIKYSKRIKGYDKNKIYYNKP